MFRCGEISDGRGFESHRARGKTLGFLLQFRNPIETFYTANSRVSDFGIGALISEFVQPLNGPLRLLSVSILGSDCYRVGHPPTDPPTVPERTRVGSLWPPEVRCGTSPGPSVSPSEEEGTRLVAQRSGPGANRPRPRDRPEAAPLPWGADPEVRAHALDQRERAACLRCGGGRGA